MTMTGSGNIYLIGFSGTGKTLSGIKAAERLQLPFVDMDEIIQYRTRKPIHQIFEEDGEDVFRKMETDLLKEIARKGNRVVSTGGGVPTIAENRKLMQKSGVIILLTANPATIHQRISTRSNRSQTLRPLIGDNAPVEKVAELLQNRAEAYSCASESIDTEGLSHDEVGQAIERIWKQHSTNQTS